MYKIENSSNETIALMNANFWNLINNKNYNFVIPRIQRDYVQGNKENICRKLLQDIKEALINNKILDLGFVYGYIDDDKFIPIDGQQRLTTLFLIYIYVLSKLKKDKEVEKIIANFSYDTRLTTKRFFQRMMALKKYFDVKNNFDIKKFIKNENFYSIGYETDPSVQAALNTLEFIDEKFFDCDDKTLKLLIDNKCPIQLQFLDVNNIGNSEDLYIKMNSRGKELSHFESFKSNFYNYYNKSIDDEFKIKFEDECYEKIYNYCNKKQINPIKETDKKYMSLIHYLLFVIAALNIDNKEKFNELNNLYIDNAEDNYFEKYNIKNSLNDYTLKSIKNFVEIFLQIDLDRVDIANVLFEEYSMPNIVRLSAIMVYANNICESNIKYEQENFEKYYRIINNLVDNTDIDRIDRLYSAINGLNKINNESLNDLEAIISNKDCNKTFIDGFNKEQQKEEIIKAYGIVNYPNIKKFVYEIENLKYFKSEIMWAMKLIGYNEINYKNYNDVIVDATKILKLFNTDGYNVNENIFKRALLTFGDYSLAYSKNGNSKTFFFEGGKGYYNLRRLLREDLSFDIFVKLYNNIDYNDVEDSLNNMINKFGDQSNEFIYYSIKRYDEIYNDKNYLSRQKRYIYDKDGKIIILCGERLSGYYYEFHSYCLKVLLEKNGYNVLYNWGIGYLGGKESKCYISKINGKDYDIYYSNNKYYIDEKEYSNKTIKEIFDILIKDI